MRDKQDFLRTVARSRRKEDTMLYEIIFVAGLFATRIVLPVMLTLVLGEWIARRTNRNQAGL